ncbi:MAG: pyridoxal phosphate-dependent aminotransferase [Lentimonas sp.]
MEIANELINSVKTTFSKKAGEKVAAGEKLISLGLGEPYFETPIEIVDATIAALRDGKTRYCNCLGWPALRELVAEKFRDENKIDVQSNNVVITVGAKQAFLVALQALVRPGDEVINVTPCFLSFIPQIKIAEPDCIIRNINISAGDFTFDMDKICESINEKTKVVIINTPHNPCGTMLTEADAEQLIRKVKQYPDCYIISDEIYEYLSWSGERHISLGAYPVIKDRVFTINGMSKTFSMTGWRLGYMAVPSKWMPTVSAILQHSNMNVTTFVQVGACASFTLDRSFLTDYCKDLKVAAEYLYEELKDTALNVVMPKGGFFCFVDISKTSLSSDEFATALLDKTNVAVNPGIQLGDDWDSHIRISFAGNFDELKRGVAGIKAFLES